MKVIGYVNFFETQCIYITSTGCFVQIPTRFLLLVLLQENSQENQESPQENQENPQENQESRQENQENPQENQENPLQVL